MDPETTVIRQSIEDTRADLTRKLETLEEEVIGTVRGARAAVADTVETVKDTVDNTVHAVKETLDVKLQTQHHPWPMFGASVFAGFVIGSYLPPPSGRRSRRAQGVASADLASADGNGAEGQSARSRFLGGIWNRFQPEIQQLKGVAIGAAAGLVRDAIEDALPPAVVPDVQEVIQSVARKLGAREIRGPILK